MTLARNRRQQLNGSKLWLLCIGLSLTISSCALFRNAGTSGKEKGGPEPRERNDKVYDPETGEYIYVEDARTLIDTVEWRPAPGAPDPITDAPPIPEPAPGNNIALLIPLDAYANQYFDLEPDSRTKRFLHFYGGVRLAAEELDSIRPEMKLRIFDSLLDRAEIDQLIRSRQLRDMDLIIGPYEKVNIEEVATFGDKNGIPVISPWQPASKGFAGHQWLVQSTPGFMTHVLGIRDFIRDTFPSSRIIIVGRDNDSEKGRIALFQDAFLGIRDTTSAEYTVESFIVGDKSADLAGTDITHLVQEDQVSVFILPHYTSSEESFVLSFLRKLHASKGNHDIVVFGLPQWANYQKLNYDYLESLNVYISSNFFVDRSLQPVRDFERRFYEAYGAIPEYSAYQGYDIVRYFGGMCARYGRAMLQFFPAEDLPVSLAFEFGVKPVVEANSTSEPPGVLEYYENDKVLILKFQDQAFHKVR